MRKLFFVLAGFLFTTSYAQQKGKDYTNILKSKNIYEINAFLIEAHPDDPRRSILKPKVMGMMNEYIQEALPGDPKVRQMQTWLATLKRKSSLKIDFKEFNENLKKQQILKLQKELQAKQNFDFTLSNPQNVYVNSSVDSKNVAVIQDTEAAEFNALMTESADQHKDKTVKLLNSLFDNDPNSKECIIMITNNSDCNIIVRIDGVGDTKYKLPVPAGKENSLVVAKGDYLLTSLVCGSQYASQKTIQKPLMVTLGNN